MLLPASNLDELLRLEETIQRKIAYAAASDRDWRCDPGSSARSESRSSWPTTASRSRLLREERPSCLNRAATRRHFRRGVPTSTGSRRSADGLIRTRVERSTDGLRAPASGRRWQRSTAGCSRPRSARTERRGLAFVTATDVLGASGVHTYGTPEVDENPLALPHVRRSGCPIHPAGDPARRRVRRGCSTPGRRRARPSARSWMRLTDPANLQPDVRGVLRQLQTSSETARRAAA